MDVFGTPPPDTLSETAGCISVWAASSAEARAGSFVPSWRVFTIASSQCKQVGCGRRHLSQVCHYRHSLHGDVPNVQTAETQAIVSHKLLLVVCMLACKCETRADGVPSLVAEKARSQHVDLTASLEFTAGRTLSEEERISPFTAYSEEMGLQATCASSTTKFTNLLKCG